MAQLQVDQVPHERNVPTADALKAEMESSRLSLGPLRLIPMVEVSNAGYDSNVFARANGEAKVSDWTATVGAGGLAIFPMGSKLFLRVLALPQYIWYDQLADRRTWGGDYAASVLALGNRLSLVLAGSLNKGSYVPNSETQISVIETTKDASGNFEVNMTRAVTFVAGAEVREKRYSDLGQDPSNPLDVQELDRTDSAVLAGLRWRVLPFLDVSGGAQGTRTEFVEQPELRDNQTVAYVGGVRIDRPKFFLNIAGGYRKGESFNSSLFQNYSTAIGSYFLSWNLVRPVALEAYGHRAPVYSRSAFDQLYVETRNGGALVFRLGSRIAVRGYGEFGTNSYPFAVSGEGKKVDDATLYGGGLSVLIFGSTVLRAQAYQSTIKPTVQGGIAQTVFRFYTALSFSGKLTQ